MKTLAIIPARGGSKGLPGKNIYPVGNPAKPLIQFTIEAALGCSLITDVFVCTEDQKIIDTVTGLPCYDKLVEQGGIITRPRHLAEDDTTMDQVVWYCVQELLKEGLQYDAIILLQPTSPLRTSHDITNAIHAYNQLKAISLISCYVPKHHPLKAFKIHAGKLSGLINNEFPFENRQYLPECVYPNGAIYITDYNDFIVNSTFFATNSTVPYLMPANRSIDVDTIEDIEEVEKYFLLHN